MNHHGFVGRRRLTRVAGGALAVSVALGVAGCLGDQSAEPTRALTGDSPAVEPVTSPASDSPTEDPAPVVPEPAIGPVGPADVVNGEVDLLPNDKPEDGTDVGYATGYFAKGGTIYLIFDRVTMLTGEEAREAREAAGLPYEEGVDGLSVYIENTNPALREVPVEDSATVVGSQHLRGDASQGPAELELADLMLHLDDAERPLLVELEYDGVRVGTVKEIYLP